MGSKRRGSRSKEQLHDDEKKAWCLAELDTADDKKKELEHLAQIWKLLGSKDDGNSLISKANYAELKVFYHEMAG